MVYYYWHDRFGSKQSSLSNFSVLVYHSVVFSPCYFKQTINLKPILNQHDPNNWLYISRWLIVNMLRQYYTIIRCRYEANANIVNGNPILSQYGLTRERQRQFCQWENLHVGLIYLCCLGSFSGWAGSPPGKTLTTRLQPLASSFFLPVRCLSLFVIQTNIGVAGGIREARIDQVVFCHVVNGY